MEKLLDIMVRLRDRETGCPWDREQTFASIAPYTIEEAYEVADAIDRGDMEELREELGDLLFQVVFHAQMAGEAGYFDFAEVVEAISSKMLRRHPHVFGGASAGNAEELGREWEKHKAEERSAKCRDASPSLMDGVARALPALVRAGKLQKRAAKVGFDWPHISGVFEKVREELEEVSAELASGSGSERVCDELGDLLFACVNLARHAGVNAESALGASNDKFERRFRALEAMLVDRGKNATEASLEEMDALWEQVKIRELESDDLRAKPLFPPPAGR